MIASLYLLTSILTVLPVAVATVGVVLWAFGQLTAVLP